MPKSLDPSRRQAVDLLQSTGHRDAHQDPFVDECYRCAQQRISFPPSQPGELPTPGDQIDHVEWPDRFHERSPFAIKLFGGLALEHISGDTEDTASPLTFIKVGFQDSQEAPMRR